MMNNNNFVYLARGVSFVVLAITICGYTWRRVYDVEWTLITQGDTPETYCSQMARISHYEKVCVEHPINDTGVSLVILDHDRKTFGCLIGKTGTKSWLSYLVRTKTDGPIGNVRSQENMKKHNFEYLKVGAEQVPQVLASYRNWTKYLIVRHPLQRLVSAYYEAVVFRQRVPKVGNDTISFAEFAGRIVSGDLLNYDLHWMFYRLRCHVCKVNYDFVIKQETFRHDTELFTKIHNIPTEHGVTRTHGNKYWGDIPHEAASNSSYKYDTILRSFQRDHPDTMTKLLGLDMYGYDMDLFGYQWDSEAGRSSCLMETEKDKCC